MPYAAYRIPHAELPAVFVRACFKLACLENIFLECLIYFLIYLCFCIFLLLYFIFFTLMQAITDRSFPFGSGTHHRAPAVPSCFDFLFPLAIVKALVFVPSLPGHIAPITQSLWNHLFSPFLTFSLFSPLLSPLFISKIPSSHLNINPVSTTQQLFYLVPGLCIVCVTPPKRGTAPLDNDNETRQSLTDSYKAKIPSGTPVDTGVRPSVTQCCLLRTVAELSLHVYHHTDDCPTYSEPSPSIKEASQALCRTIGMLSHLLHIVHILITL